MLPTSQSLFSTRTPANTPVKMVLRDPLTGEATDQFLMVYGADSDAFRDTRAQQQRDLLMLKGESKEVQMKAAADTKLVLFVALVASWSFEEALTPEAVRAFLTECPQIADELDLFISKRANFLPVRSSTSTPSQSETSASA